MEESSDSASSLETLVLAGAVLVHLADRTGNASGEHPCLVTAAALVPVDEQPQGERARLAANKVLRPLSTYALLTAARHGSASRH